MRRDAVASQASRNAAGELGKPPFGSRIPASRGVEGPRRCLGIARGPSPAEKPGYGIVWVPYIGFYPLDAFTRRDLLCRHRHRCCRASAPSGRSDLRRLRDWRRLHRAVDGVAPGRAGLRRGAVGGAAGRLGRLRTQRRPARRRPAPVAGRAGAPGRGGAGARALETGGGSQGGGEGAHPPPRYPLRLEIGLPARRLQAGRCRQARGPGRGLARALRLPTDPRRAAG